MQRNLKRRNYDKGIRRPNQTRAKKGQELEDNLNKALEKETPESWEEFLNEEHVSEGVEIAAHRR